MGPGHGRRRRRRGDCRVTRPRRARTSRRGSVVVLACRRRGAIEARRTRSYAAAAAQSNTRELVALAGLSYRHEPSCLVVPSPPWLR